MAAPCSFHLLFETDSQWVAQEIRSSLAGQDVRFSHGRPGPESWWREFLMQLFCSPASLHRKCNSSGRRSPQHCHVGVWRNGSASDSRSEGWEFESLCPHFVGLAPELPSGTLLKGCSGHCTGDLSQAQPELYHKTKQPVLRISSFRCFRYGMFFAGRASCASILYWNLRGLQSGSQYRINATKRARIHTRRPRTA